MIFKIRKSFFKPFKLANCALMLIFFSCFYDKFEVDPSEKEALSGITASTGDTSVKSSTSGKNGNTLLQSEIENCHFNPKDPGCSDFFIKIDPGDFKKNPNQIPVTKSFYIFKWEAAVFPAKNCAGEQLGTRKDDYNCEEGGCKNKIFACALKNVNPSHNINYTQAKSACENSGFRLCSGNEWMVACQGTPEGEANQCNVPAKMGNDLVYTGYFPKCISNYEVFDLVGNLYELTDDTSGKVVKIRGGTYILKDGEKVYLENGLNCTLKGEKNILDDDKVLGFRCCFDE